LVLNVLNKPGDSPITPVIQNFNKSLGGTVWHTIDVEMEGVSALKAPCDSSQEPPVSITDERNEH
jgi:hypothetical protein